MQSRYFIAKGRRSLGPCSIDDVRSFLAYGSINDNDLFRAEHESQWQPIWRMPGLMPGEGVVNAREIELPRRIARYRDYAKVPYDLRGSVVLRRLIVGFLLFPPLLWKAASTIFQARVYSRKEDENGYLLMWPASAARPLYAILAANAVIWVVLLIGLFTQAAPLARGIASFSSTGIESLQEWLGRK